MALRRQAIIWTNDGWFADAYMVTQPQRVNISDHFSVHNTSQYNLHHIMYTYISSYFSTQLNSQQVKTFLAGTTAQIGCLEPVSQNFSVKNPNLTFVITLLLLVQTPETFPHVSNKVLLLYVQFFRYNCKISNYSKIYFEKIWCWTWNTFITQVSSACHTERIAIIFQIGLKYICLYFLLFMSKHFADNKIAIGVSKTSWSLE